MLGGDFTPFSCLLFSWVGKRSGGQGSGCKGRLERESCSGCWLGLQATEQCLRCLLTLPFALQSVLEACYLHCSSEGQGDMGKPRLLLPLPTLVESQRLSPGRVPMPNLAASIFWGANPVTGGATLVNIQESSFSLHQKLMKKQEIGGWATVSLFFFYVSLWQSIWFLPRNILMIKHSVRIHPWIKENIAIEFDGNMFKSVSCS